MLKNPEYGWCEFLLFDFYGTPSYLTNVPVDLLRAFVDYFKRGTGIAWFDEEDSQFTLIMNPYSLFIIFEGDKVVTYDLSWMDPKKLAQELIEDITNDFDKWSEWTNDMCENTIIKNKKYINFLIAELKDLIQKK